MGKFTIRSFCLDGGLSIQQKMLKNFATYKPPFIEFGPSLPALFHQFFMDILKKMKERGEKRKQLISALLLKIQSASDAAQQHE